MYKETKKDFSTKVPQAIYSTLSFKQKPLEFHFLQMDWGAAAGVKKTDFGSKLKTEASAKRCLVADCQNAQIAGKNYCVQHQNRSVQGTGTVKPAAAPAPAPEEEVKDVIKFWSVSFASPLLFL